MKQTAVEWFGKKVLDVITTDEFNKLLEQAKEMEKEQIMEALGVGFNDGQSYMDGKPKYNSALEYYNETFRVI